MKRLTYFWRKGLWTIVSLAFILTILSIGLYCYLENQLPNVDALNSIKLQVPLRIYTKDGKLIQEYGEKKRIPISYVEIPPLLIKAILATEDQRFFEHSGVDVIGLGRAAIRMLRTGTKSQGGSTITMQVARNFFLSRKKTFLRKFNEILLAIKIDHELSKERILELYLNKIYLGNRAYGVGAAAAVYYGKPLKNLSVAELATIAGLPQAPSTQNPIANPAAARKRRDHVLDRMFAAKYITESQYKDALIQPITSDLYGTQVEINAPYVAEMIRQSLYDYYGEKAYTNGYKVYTTINSTLQKTATDVVAAHILAYDHRRGYRGPVANIGSINNLKPATIQKLLAPYPNIEPLEPAIVLELQDRSIMAITRHGLKYTILQDGASWSKISKIGDIIYFRHQDGKYILSQIPQVEASLVALDPNNGAIQALVGGFNFIKSKFNRAIQSNRQPGSSFKPFLYAAALNKGYTLATLINDSPIVVDDPSQPTVWRPHNHTYTFNGPMRLKEALVNSRNLVSIRILDDLGFDYVIDFASKFGLNKEPLPRGLSLALGTLSVSPLDLTTAYAVFANGGFKISPYLIDHITNNDGKLLLQAKSANATQQSFTQAPRAIPADVAFLMVTALKDVIQHGTATAAKILNRHDIAGKTGTTNDQVDAWFAGFNSDLVVTTWMGYDTPQSLHAYATSSALPIWIDFMKVALQHLPEKALLQPENIVAVKIDPHTGRLAKANQANAITEYFREEDIPVADESEGTENLF
ncbi:MAG: peptidase [Legionellales bacterium RIFCSPHIGHO2_12_FULL_42_9]|nr:MAG: peptidase [Legionellales bacterium RIFCSPHIGHO2_12_FULL_42_9]